MCKALRPHVKTLTKRPSDETIIINRGPPCVNRVSRFGLAVRR